MVTTAVGYAGGYTPNATYEEVCSGRTGHTEVVRVIYDPNKVSYETLLKAFWESHDPTQGMRQGNDVGTQYRSAIYYTTDAQKKAAEASKRRYQEALTQGASRDHHHRDPGRAGVLLRRGISPAVPGEESERLLRARWLRSHVLGGLRRSAEGLSDPHASPSLVDTASCESGSSCRALLVTLMYASVSFARRASWSDSPSPGPITILSTSIRARSNGPARWSSSRYVLDVPILGTTTDGRRPALSIE